MRVEPALTKAALDDIDADLIRPNLAKHGGRTLEVAEDRTVLEFADAKQAVLFAIVIQLAMQSRNKNLREDRQILYRIGIETLSTADGATDNDETQNIASGLSELTEPGRICVSSHVYSDISDALDLTVEPIEERPLNQVPERILSFEVKLDATAGAAVAASAKPPQLNRRSAVLGALIAALVILAAGTSLYFYQTGQRQSEANTPSVPQKPTIAVMPFENLSTDTKGAMFAHGITASIISALAQVPQLFVISSSSAFSFAQQFGGTREVGREFGVRYVLVGSVQINNNIRVIAELSDTQTGETLWTERYDRSQDDVFAVQDEITLSVLVSLQVALTEGHRAVVRGHGTQNVSAYLGLLNAEKEFRNYTRASMVETRQLLQDVRRLDPGYYHAMLLEARTHTFDAQWGYSDDAEASLQTASEILQEAALLDGNMSEADKAEVQITQAYIEQMDGNFGSALSLALAAVEASPNNSNLLATAGWVASFDRDYERSIRLLKSAIAHDPIYPSWYANFLSRSYVFQGQPERAIEWAEDGVNRSENDRRRAWALVNLAFAYEAAGQSEEARGSADEARALWPDISIATLERAQPFQHQEDWQIFASAMRANGIPE
ncbi:MAG: tetratricopeptide repeat protein [Hyphomicrobiales bacterium]|nr:tetratricopeptide repeat protein [Hyphomicrobiales bacterium]MCP4997277.1 tetratricopeptide repeat protein [Hyphomicrobiales bacterium]